MTDFEELQALAETSSFDLAREVLALREKAGWFDYLAHRMEHAKIRLDFGGNENIYLDRAGPEALMEILQKCAGWEDDADND